MQAVIKPAEPNQENDTVRVPLHASFAKGAGNITQFPSNESGGPVDPNRRDIQQEVDDIQCTVLDAIQESSLDEKVEGLRTAVERLSEGADSWRIWRKGLDGEAFQQLKDQVDQVQTEWQALTAGLHGQRERLEALLSSFPSVVEVSAVRALGLRMNHLEHLVANLVDQKDVRSTRRISRTQLGISIAGLSVTVVLWGAFYSMRVLGI